MRQAMRSGVSKQVQQARILQRASGCTLRCMARGPGSRPCQTLMLQCNGYLAGHHLLIDFTPWVCFSIASSPRPGEPCTCAPEC